MKRTHKKDFTINDFCLGTFEIFIFSRGSNRFGLNRQWGELPQYTQDKIALKYFLLLCSNLRVSVLIKVKHMIL